MDASRAKLKKKPASEGRMADRPAWRASDDSSELHQEAIQKLRQPVANQRDRHEIESEYNALRSMHPAHKSERDEYWQGVLGIALLSVYAGLWHDSEPSTNSGSPSAQDIGSSGCQRSHRDLKTDDKLARANSYLHDPCTLKSMRQIYEISRCVSLNHGSNLAAVGTTSLILKTEAQRGVGAEYEPAAVKILKPRFLQMQKIESSTRRYSVGPLGPHLFTAPIVFWAGNRYIAMEWVAGQTLNEYLLQRTEPQESPPADRLQRIGRLVRKFTGAQKIESQIEAIGAIQPILADICNVLGEYSRDKIHHGDISVDNIILWFNRELGKLQPVFIDFGLNYVLLESIGTSDEIHAIKASAPPEFLSESGVREPTLEGDVFSLGVVIAHMLLRELFAPQDLMASLDLVYATYPGFGSILDDMLDPNPSRRLMAFERGNNGDVFAVIRETIDDELELKLSWLEKSKRIQSLVIPFIEVVFPGAKHWLFRERHITRDLRAAWVETQYFAITVLVAGALIHIAVSHHVHENTGPIVLGMLVGVTLSRADASYYVTVLAGVPDVAMGRIVQMLLRVNTWTIGLALVYLLGRDYVTECMPIQAWALGSAIGLGGACLSNLACGRFCARKAQPAMARAGLPVTAAMDHTRTQFLNWARSGFAYVALLLLLQVGFSLGLLKDGVYWAILAVGANVLMYYWNCLQQGPLMRTGLSRFLSGFVRAGRGPEIRPKSSWSEG